MNTMSFMAGDIIRMQKRIKTDLAARLQLKFYK
ncbi:hypothetical protein AXFE_21480 [Acidithrix ferrooxidans]|uniref:Uncharacterized protein n=1 Tax=Acidithrix ferrooxidans TaxID=1280514 RepID=A0A0D8HGF9_9ACTN|nr:hypothetical protein AXFE_21480 [Acidithrix ferrooxidans]